MGTGDELPLHFLCTCVTCSSPWALDTLPLGGTTSHIPEQGVCAILMIVNLLVSYHIDGNVFLALLYYSEKKIPNIRHIP